MPDVTTTYNVKLLHPNGTLAGSGTISFGTPDQNGGVTVSFTSGSSGIPSVSGSGTLTQCGGISTLQVTPSATSLFSLQASVYAVGVSKYTTAGIGGGIAMFSGTQGFAGALIGAAQPTAGEAAPRGETSS